MSFNRNNQNNGSNFNANLKKWMLFGLFTSLAMHGFVAFRPDNLLGYLLVSQPAVATPVPKTNTIPTKYINNAPVPDWQNITFKSFVFSSPGRVELPKAKIPGYKSVRTWKAGQSLDEVMELGDFENVFNLEDFSLRDIEQLSGTYLKNLKLSDFRLIKWQTVPEITKAIPKLANVYVEDVPVIKNLVEERLGIQVTSNQTIRQVINNYPELKDIELGEINLSSYKLTSIPEIENTALKNFTNWQNTTISRVPGLNQVTFNNFPNVPMLQGNITGKVDLTLKEVENRRQRSISGSYKEGFNVPCTQNCAHIELSGAGRITGAQWMSGKFQEVKGGFGVLGKLNSGKEPTGRHPFGKSFKQVVWNIDEASGTATTAMFFRICKRGGWVDLGCSPYFIGPFPFFSYQEKSPIFIGTPLKVP